VLTARPSSACARQNGFFYCVSKLCGLTVNLYRDGLPDTEFGKVVDVVISLWGMALAGVIVGCIAALSIISTGLKIAERSQLRRRQVEDVAHAVAELGAEETMDFEAFYTAMEEHAHTSRDSAQAVFDDEDTQRKGVLSKKQAQAMLRHWRRGIAVEELSAAQRADRVAAVAAKHGENAPETLRAKAEVEELGEPHWIRVMVVFLVFVFTLVPAIILIASLILGALLAEAEGWKPMQGFLYVLTNLCVLGGPLTDVEPDSDRGRAVDVLVGLWALSVQASVMGVVAALSIHDRMIKAAETFSPAELLPSCLRASRATQPQIMTRMSSMGGEDAYGAPAGDLEAETPRGEAVSQEVRRL